MYKTSLLFVFLLLSCCLWSQTTYVLSTGVSRYVNEEFNLKQTTKDAKAFKAIWNKHSEHVSILTSKFANRDNIIEKLRGICSQATDKDRIVFFYSGHGFPGGMAVYDNVIYYSELSEILSSSKAAQKIVFVDACHAGSVANEVGDDAYKSLKSLSKSGQIVYFMSCRSDEYSTEHSWLGHGFFTQALLKGLRGKSDENSDKRVTVIELFRFVYKDVLHSANGSMRQQHPQLIAPRECHDWVLLNW